MIEAFKAFIKQNDLFEEREKVLLAVSGGADSVAMLDLFVKAGYKIGLAHCNFKLRGDASEKDAQFVKKLSEKHLLPFHSIEFETKTFARDNSYSMEEAARIMRYQWFEKIRKTYGYNYIATAHHADDSIETFFINLTAGTGIRGVQGIKARNGVVIRPLLFAYKSEILDYCQKNKIEYRTDQSNFDTKIVRNKIRHDIIPEFEKINPSFKQTMQKNLKKFKEVKVLYSDSIKRFEKRNVSSSDEYTYINISALRQTAAKETYLYEILKKYGFNSSTISNIAEGLNRHAGKIFYSDNYRLLRDRDYLIIDNIEKPVFNEIRIPQNINEFELPQGKIKISEFPADTEIDFASARKNVAFFDSDKIEFPLSMRTYKPGDYFYPFGMKGKKKLSDYFTDRKYNLFQKERALLLCSANNIIWLVGERSDNRFRVMPNTKNILQIRFE